MIRMQIERERRRWSKRKLAKRAHVDAAIVSYAENRHFLPYPKQASGFAEALGWEGDPSELFEEVGDHDVAAV